MLFKGKTYVSDADRSMNRNLAESRGTDAIGHGVRPAASLQLAEDLGTGPYRHVLVSNRPTAMRLTVYCWESQEFVGLIPGNEAAPIPAVCAIRPVPRHAARS